MYRSTESGVKRVCDALARGLLRAGTLSACRANVASVLSSISWLDVRMKADIRSEAEALARSCMVLARTHPWAVPDIMARRFDGIMKAFNRSYRKAWKRTASTYIHSQMRLQRGRDEPVVFYLVSSHQKPQPAHEPLQGTVLVDRMWRSATNGDERVERYIKAHRTKTLQWAMGAPHYLITRPNCRHYVMPIPTAEAVGSSVRQLIKRHQKKPTHVHRPLTDAQRAQAYRSLKRAVLDIAMRYAPAKGKAGL